MNIKYSTEKILPCEKLYELFLAVGWVNKNEKMLDVFNPSFIGSDVVISAWDNDKLVGCIRALSNKAVRSVIYDLAVLPEYQNKGIGKELVKRCIETYPNSEWVLGTTEKNVEFYKKLGF
jgi:ribosomal protein S18 acetylase RimI-like enzyme